MTRIPTLNSLSDARNAMFVLSKRIDALEVDSGIHGGNVDDIRAVIARRLLTFGVRIGVVTTEITAATSLVDIGSGFVRLSSQVDIVDDSEEPSPAYNISEDVYLVGSRVCVFQFMDSYFVISDSGVDPVVVLPVVDLLPPPGATFFEWISGSENNVLNAGVPYISVSDDGDGVDPSVDLYTLELRLIDGVFTFDQGDSDVTQTVVNTSDIFLHGTLDALNDFLIEGTTGTLTVNPPVPGTDSLVAVLRADGSQRQGTNSMGVLISAAAPAPSTVDVGDEGSLVVTAIALNFIGAGVTATDGGSGVASVTIPGGSGVTTIETYAAGTAYTLTATPAAVTFGTTSPTITLAAAGTYIISFWVRVNYVAATFTTNRVVTVKLRRTNNTAADLANGSIAFITPVITATNIEGALMYYEASLYTTTNSDDAITIFADVSVVPSAGSAAVSNAWIKARKVA